MISFNYELNFKLDNEPLLRDWLLSIAMEEQFEVGDINFVFTDDTYLHHLNTEFLNHDTLTDIISFDYSVGKTLHGDVFISVERVIENAHSFNVSFDDELSRVMAHGILHYIGYNDKNVEDKNMMTIKEDYYLDKLQNVPRETL